MKLDSAELTAKLKLWSKKLGIDKLYRIEFIISPDSCEDDITTMAHVQTSIAYRQVTITFFEPAIDPKMLDATIVHELLHVVLERVDSMCQQAMGKKFEKMVSDEIENAIEFIAPIILKCKK